MLALALLAVVGLIGLVLGGVGTGVVARARAQSAADLAALAAGDLLAIETLLAGVSPGSSEACDRARRVTARNGAELESCATEPGSVVVVKTSVDTVLGPARAAARAGPAR